MRFAELLKNNTSNDKIPCIAFLGDSVTQGVFEVYEKNGKMEFVIDGICAYPTKVKEMLNKMYEEIVRKIATVIGVVVDFNATVEEIIEADSEESAEE